MNPNRIPVQIKRLTETAILPVYGSNLAAGMDLHADIEHQIVVGPGEQATIPTGVAIALPGHLALLICPRSGLSSKSRVTVHNGPGVIDADYRGGIGVVLHNTGFQQFVVHPGDRIAQGVIVPVFQAVFEEVENLGETDRGTGGFGSTGMAREVGTGVVTDTGVHSLNPRPAMSAAEAGYRFSRQMAHDRREQDLPACMTKWLDAEPEEAQVGMQKALAA